MYANVAHDLQGRRLAGRYLIERLLARGGMAEIWMGLDLVLNRPVAVKVLHAELAADERFLERFRREAVAAAGLNHPGIVAIYDTCSSDDVEAIVMELVPGRNLRTFLDEHGPMSPAEVVAIGAQAAEALEVAHAAQLVHRDIKPANLLLVEAGEGEARRVMITDFGISKAAGSSDLTQLGSVVGTVKYLAPEQVEGGEVTPRTDIYALGAVLYEALCGRPPFQEDSDVATALARVRQAPLLARQLRADVPRALDTALMRALARDPADRFSSAAELRAALLATPTADATSVIDATAWPEPSPPGAPQPFVATERSWLVPTGIVFAVAAVLVALAVLLSRNAASRNLVERVLHGGGQDATAETSTPPATAPGRRLDIAAVTSFDPFDRDTGAGEHDATLPNLLDNDPTTTWRTQTYDSNLSPAWKAGVGVVFALDESAELADLTLRSAMTGWTVELYVADVRPGDLAGWGKPTVTGTVASAADSNPEHHFDLGHQRGRFVLVWITSLAGNGQFTPGKYGVEWQDVELRA